MYPVRLLFCAMLLAGPLTFARGEQESLLSPTKHVLILYTHRVAMPISQQWDRGIRAALQAESKHPITIDVEYVDSDRLGGKEAIDKLFDLLRLKYAANPPDLVIPVFDPSALAYTSQSQRLFPNADVVFCSVHEKALPKLKGYPRSAGISYRLDYQKTLDLAKQLIPSLKRVIVICGSSQENLALLNDLKSTLPPRPGEEIDYWVGTPIDTMCQQAQELPSDTVLLFLVHDRDINGVSFATPHEVAAKLAESSSAPMFALYDTLIGSGVVGGVMAPVEAQGRKAGGIAAQILNGATLAEPWVSGVGMNRKLVDWQQLQRWKIDPKRIPSDAEVVVLQVSAWERYSYYLLPLLATLALQTLLIGGLWINRKQRLEAERKLAGQFDFEKFLSEIRSRFINVPLDQLSGVMGHTLRDVTKQIGLDFGAIYETSGDQLVLRSAACDVPNDHPAPAACVDLSAIAPVWKRLNAGEVVSNQDANRLDGSDPDISLGQGYRPGWLIPLKSQGMNLGVASFGSSRKHHLPDETCLQRLLPLSDLLANVLAREKSDRELQISRGNAQQLARKLLTAQEDERRRLAREMHDDITQRLAAASIACGQLRNDESLSQTSRSEMADLSESLIKISKDVHQFSRRLHPSILEELGLLDAIRYECNMVKAQGDFRLTIRYGNLPDNLPKELQLCLYRVAQESLRNMAKHSRASEGEIVLSADAESIRLQVNDNGVGLTATRDREQPGLGLIAMEERVLLVGGSIEITSHAGPGTCIDVRLPLALDEPEPPETS
jgi:signal transduction histidine kinase/ABC-type uncharacterized transport system substrate-binding protein